MTTFGGKMIKFDLKLWTFKISQIHAIKTSSAISWNGIQDLWGLYRVVGWSGLGASFFSRTRKSIAYHCIKKVEI